MAPDDDPFPYRRDRDQDRRRWPDERLDDLASAVRAVAPLATNVAVNTTHIDDVRRDVEALASSFKEFAAEYREDKKQSGINRTHLIVAGISMLAIVLAALITATAALLTA